MKKERYSAEKFLNLLLGLLATSFSLQFETIVIFLHFQTNVTDLAITTLPALQSMNLRQLYQSPFLSPPFHSVTSHPSFAPSPLFRYHYHLLNLSFSISAIYRSFDSLHFHSFHFSPFAFIFLHVSFLFLLPFPFSPPSFYFSFLPLPPNSFPFVLRPSPSLTSLL